MMNEFKELIEKASKQLGHTVHMTVKSNGWSVYKAGAASDDVYNGTFDQCIAKLKEWATPPKPDFVMVKVPYDVAKMYAKNGYVSDIATSCKEAIKPYEV